MLSKSWIGIVPFALGLMAGPSVSAQPPECLQAVFFDLGDTLVEAGPGGLFYVRAGAQETVDALQAAAIQVGVITNVPAGWDREDLEALLDDPGFLDEFDVLVLSSQAPAPKPNPLIYTFAHGQLPIPVPIEASAFVGETIGEIGNHATAPTAGARAVGMVGIHLGDPGMPSLFTDFTIDPDDLLEVVDIVAPGCVFRDGLETGDATRWSAQVP